MPETCRLNDLDPPDPAEAPLGQASEWAQALIDASSVHMCGLAADGRVLIVNRAWQAFAAANQGDTACIGPGCNYLEVCDAAASGGSDEGRRFADGLRQVLAGRQASFELAYACHAPAEQRWFQARVKRVEGMRALVALVEHLDHTAPRIELLALSDSERRHRALFDNVLNAVLLANDDGRYVDANPAALAQLGYSLAEMRSKRVVDLVVDIDPDVDPLAAWRVFRAQGQQRGRVRLRHRDGHVLTFEYSAVSQMLPGLHLSVLSDITEQKRAEDGLRASLAELRETQRLAGIGSWRLDLATGKAEWSVERYRIFGRDPALGAATLPELQRYFTPASWQLLHEASMRLRREGTPYRLDLELVREDGEQRWLVSHAEAVRDAFGAIVGLRGNSIDVTALRQAEEARVLAQQANRAKSEFLSRMSHELRTPLNAVIGFADVLKLDKDHPLTDRQQRHLSFIRSAGGHLLSLIDDLLDISRIEIGEMRLQLQDLDLAPLCRQAVDDLSHDAQEQAVTVHFFAPTAKLPRVHVDPTRLRQVVHNLLSNAIKYNRPGGQVRLALAHDGDHVSLKVEDSGLGMTDAQRAQLFQPFNRLGREGTSIRGAGIGLAITQQILRAMDGEIEVRSEHGVGTTFKVLLPAARVRNGVDEAVGLVAEETHHADPPTQRDDVQARLLYIEDDETNRLLVTEHLRWRPGIRVTLAVDAASGLRLATAHRPDLILLDMSLPDMHGLELLQCLRAEPRTADVPVLALSANVLPQDIERALQAGVAAYLCKPVGTTLLLAHIDAHLSPREAAMGSSEAAALTAAR